MMKRALTFLSLILLASVYASQSSQVSAKTDASPASFEPFYKSNRKGAQYMYAGVYFPIKILRLPNILSSMTLISVIPFI